MIYVREKNWFDTYRLWHEFNGICDVQNFVQITFLTAYLRSFESYIELYFSATLIAYKLQLFLFHIVFTDLCKWVS